MASSVVHASAVRGQMVTSMLARSAACRASVAARPDQKCQAPVLGGTRTARGQLSPGRTRPSGSGRGGADVVVQLPARTAGGSTHCRSTTSGAGSADGPPGRPTALRSTPESSAADLEALCGSLFNEFNIDPKELDGSMDGEDCGDRPELLPPEEMWKVSRDSSVQDVMIAMPVSCKPTDRVKDIVALFAERSGIPVVTEDRQVVGMITRKDVMKIKKKHGSLKHLVEEHMSSPAITVQDTATAEEVATTLLEKSVHRVPVVDKDGRLVGIASKSNLFSQLTGAQNESFKVKKIAGDEDLMGSDYWKQLEMMETVDLDAGEEEAPKQG